MTTTVALHHVKSIAASARSSLLTVAGASPVESLLLSSRSLRSLNQHPLSERGPFLTNLQFIALLGFLHSILINHT
jgi:hypothetical protein